MNEELRKLSTSKTLLHIIAFFILFLAGDLLSSIPFDLIFQFVILPQSWMYQLPRTAGCIAFTLFLFYIYTKKVLRLQMRDFRITFSMNVCDVCLALFLPAFVILLYMFAGSFHISQNLSAYIVAEIILCALFRALRAGILEEVLFRGYIMKLLEARWNKYIAIIFPSFIFSLMHIPSMESFSYSGVLLLIISGTLVGVMFSLITYGGNSVCGSILVHTLWNFFMATDVFHVSSLNIYDASIFSIVVPSEHPLLTGAGFGIEASIFSVAGYAVVIALLLFSMRKHGK